jgi:Ca-activated chloride channel family protein
MKTRYHVFIFIGLAALLGSCAKPPQNTTSYNSRPSYIGDPDYVGVLEAPPPAPRSFYRALKESTPAERNKAGTPGLQGGSPPTKALNFDPMPRRFALPSRTDELWIITRNPNGPFASEDYPTSGCLRTRVRDREVPLPLKHTDVKASVSAYIASVQVRQEFHNPFSEKIEAVYTFPLPENAAVNEFIMTIGDRHIRGIIREREEAEEIYREAKQQGYTASLLTQERPNIFTQSVANIEPGREIDINITYFHTLAFADGWHEFVFPMVVGPRFNPPYSRDGVGAVGRGRTGASGQATEVQYLRPGERSGHDIALHVDVDATVKIEQFECVTHKVRHEAAEPERLSVWLAKDNVIPNKDFVLRYRVSGDRLKPGLLTHRDERGGFFSLVVYPPREQRELRRQALELIFVLDCSGSMSGQPFKQAKAAIEWSLKHMEARDTFQIINFSETASKLGRAPIPATPANIRRGLDYLASLRSDGGTMMIEGIKAALDFPHDPGRLRFVCFMTDGYIGNEAEIFAAIDERLDSSRLFSFGVGTSVNRYLLDGMARIGRGTVAYVNLKDDAERIMESFFTRISHPALTDVEIDWGGAEMTDVFPRTIPDLFVGRPVIITGRYSGNPRSAIRLAGHAAGETIESRLSANWNATHPALASIWARQQITDLEDRTVREDSPRIAKQIKQLALDYSLMSAYTSFIAVDSAHRTAGRRGTTVPVAVPVPEGVRYETTVGKD